MRRPRLRSRAVLTALIAVAALVVAVIIAVLVSARPAVHTRAQFVAGTPEGTTPVRLDTTLYLPAHTPAPAILLAHGFGATKASIAGEAHALAERGFVVLAYTARGFGASGGLIHLDSPRYEVHDAQLLLTWLIAQPQVKRSAGRAQVGVAGSSYGGALALLLAGTDPRIGAVAADITWNDLATALFPNGAGTQPGVFKKMWAGYLFGAGEGAGTAGAAGAGAGQGAGGAAGAPGAGADPSVGCGRFAPDVCAAYDQVGRTGRPDAALLALLRASSPSTVLGHITAPTLLTQGEQDSLFDLGQADANARGIAAGGTPVRVQWRSGGHGSDTGTGAITGTVASWFHAAFGGSVSRDQRFRLVDQSAALSSQSAEHHGVVAAGYPGIDGTAVRTASYPLRGAPSTVAAPAGGSPAIITSLPGLGDASGQLRQLFGSGGALGVPANQVATFATAPLPRGIRIAGAGSVELSITAHSTSDATLFVAISDAAPDGTTYLPGGLVEPIYLTGLTPGRPRVVSVRLPTVVDNVPAGHRLVITVATTDLAYQLPADARSYTVALAGPGGPLAGAVRVNTIAAHSTAGGGPLGWLLAGLIACLLAAAVVAGVLLRRRRALARRDDLIDVPVEVDGLVKSYGDGYRAVDDIAFRVERGQVVGLLGPNGAGKTTVLRMLTGLIRPSAGAIHLFGEPVQAGAPVLARLGAFIEGPGFLPHLSGRDNLRVYWAASGRPADDADFDTALQIAGLGASIDRKVRTYSQGMRQRLGIAQAMLGLPELLVLDEPTNGLDPPQIAEMREVLQTYARTGRTVVVSTHLLAEVEQTCTHVVVMHRGQVVAAGSVAEVAGAGGHQLAVTDPQRAAEVLAAAGIGVELVPARRALEDVFLGLVGDSGGVRDE